MKEDYRGQDPRCFKSSVKFLQSMMILSSARVDPLNFIKSKVTQLFTGKFKGTLCSHLLTSLTEMQISFPSRTWHLPTAPKLLLHGLLTVILLCFILPANQPGLNSPVENLWDICQKGDEKHLTLKDR